MIRINKSRIMYVFGLTALFIAAVPIVAMAADSKPAMYATIWAVLPPIVAIGLALITKEVYSSLFIGILAGGLIYSGMNFPKFMNHVMIDGFVSSLSSDRGRGAQEYLVATAWEAAAREREIRRREYHPNDIFWAGAEYAPNCHIVKCGALSMVYS